MEALPAHAAHAAPGLTHETPSCECVCTHADREGFILDAPPLAEAICQDPLLKRLKLVALPSDDSLLPRWGVG